MMMTNRPFRVELTEGAKKDLKKLRQHRDRIEEVIGGLEVNPLAGHLLKGTLNPLRSVEFNARGSGAFRATYAVLNENAICLIVIVGPHRTSMTEQNAGSRLCAMPESSDVGTSSR
jgi:mRNA-degrading endonuclease RelE of RelBE toxin-antitoxin system